MRRQAAIMLLLLVLAGGPVFAQDDCPVIVQQVLTTLDSICQQTGRNQACYGNVAITAVPQVGVADFHFAQVGDIADVTAIQSLRLSPMNTASDQWGVALLRLQANLPDTLPGQNVTFLLFGDVEITSATAPGSTSRPMQAFYLKTGVNDAPCSHAPQSGLLVQTPKGVGQVTFSVNGVDMSMGSTVYFQAAPGDHLRVSTLQGAAVMRYAGNIYPVVQGTEITAPLDENLEVSGEPDYLGGYDTDEFESLPLDTLDEDIEISDPLTDEELDTLFELWDSDEPLCGEGPFPDCEEASWLLGGDSCPLDEIGTPDCGEDAWDESWGDAGFGDINYEDAFYDDTGDTQDTTDEYYDDSGDTQDNSDEYYDDSGDTGDISDDSGAGDNSGDEYYDDGGSDTGDSGDSGE